MLPEHIRKLQDAVKATHGCDAVYSHTTLVREEFEAQVAWDGLVSVFRLLDYPKARRCYAWIYRDGPDTKTVTVLEVPPVNSAESAVKIAIAAKAREAS